ncbi:MAG: Ldh family oxidoreductase [Desulfocapsaceae bacterium]|nr:Ldh family oxidoreductase [Desulfocapsaceae bacterium]
MSVKTGIDPVRLSEFATAVYVDAGMPEADARLVADTLVQADLWGHQSHGVLRLGWYLDRIRNCVMTPITSADFEVDAGAVAVINGRDGVGQVLADLARKEAVRRAKEHGIAAVGVHSSNHFGTCMYYTRLGALDGCVMLLTSNGGPAMAPWGGRRKIIGTNPWSVAAPAGNFSPLLVDMANTGVARGKIYLARNKQLPIPLGWALNSQGEPTTDPTEAIDGIILPMAEHKGYAIAVMVDMLSGVLTGSGFLSGVNSPYKTAEKSNCGHLMVAMNIAAFQPLEQFEARMETFINEIKSVPPAKGHSGVFYPGEIEAENDARCRREGLLLAVDTLADLKRIAGETGLTAKLPF